MKAILHMEKVENTNNLELDCQGSMEEASVAAGVGQSNGKNKGVEQDVGNINGIINLPDLNADVDPDEKLIDYMAIIPFQQNLTAQESRWLTLFGFDLNVLPTNCGGESPNSISTKIRGDKQCIE